MSKIFRRTCSVLLAGLMALSLPAAAQAADHGPPDGQQGHGHQGHQGHQGHHRPYHGQGKSGGTDPAEVIVCLGRGGAEAPGRACYRPKDASLRIAAGRPGAALRGELTMSLRVDQIDPFRRMLAAGDDGSTQEDVQVCIINGANICFEVPMEFVWICITTGMLAGTECPPPPEPNMVAAIVSLAGPIRP